jgi:hypothetical protein
MVGARSFARRYQGGAARMAVWRARWCRAWRTWKDLTDSVNASDLLRAVRNM